MRIKHRKRKSSVPSRFRCGICAHRKPFNNAFAIKGCNHWYCCDCIRQYVTLKIQDNIPRIHCPVPDCGGRLEPEHCRSILPSKVFDRWPDALLEAVIPDCDKFYCPSKECSALLVKGHDFEDIVKSECPVCHKLFCAKCKVPWHSRIKCGEYLKLHKDEREREDIMLRQLAKKEGWTRCSKCKFYVERISGCSSMICRCGYGFCYDCGARRKPDTSCNKCESGSDLDDTCYSSDMDNDIVNDDIENDDIECADDDIENDDIECTSDLRHRVIWEPNQNKHIRFESDLNVDDQWNSYFDRKVMML